MNFIMNLIEKENLVLEKDYGETGYAYFVDKKLITYPAFDDMNNTESIFSLAHELGHHTQQKRYNYLFKLLSFLSRDRNLPGLVFFPFLFWEEIDAWSYAWKICKSENVSMNGFISCMFKSLMSYITFFFKQIMKTLKYILALYLSCVFWIRFLILSEEMKLNQPNILQELRKLVVNSPQSKSEMITELFFMFINIYIFTLIIYLVMKFVLAFINTRNLAKSYPDSSSFSKTLIRGE